MPIKLLKHFSLTLKTSVLYMYSSILLFVAVVLAEQFSKLLFYIINIVHVDIVWSIFDNQDIEPQKSRSWFLLVIIPSSKNILFKTGN